MKNYIKPNLNLIDFRIKESIMSLNDWLSENSLTDAGITTYVINS